MRKKRYILPILSVCFAAILLFSASKAGGPPQINAPAAAVAAQKTDTPTQALFPEFRCTDVTAVSLITPQADFDLQRGKNSLVSVNGQHGDREVFDTLLDQIAGIPFTPTQAFTTSDSPLLTLIIKLGDTEYSACFYNDGSTGKYARIVSSPESTPLYGLTDGWRIGTLLLTCEGMRIQDAQGRETPVE